MKLRDIKIQLKHENGCNKNDCKLINFNICIALTIGPHFFEPYYEISPVIKCSPMPTNICSIFVIFFGKRTSFFRVFFSAIWKNDFSLFKKLDSSLILDSQEENSNIRPFFVSNQIFSTFFCGKCHQNWTKNSLVKMILNCHNNKSQTKH